MTESAGAPFVFESYPELVIQSLRVKFGGSNVFRVGVTLKAALVALLILMLEMTAMRALGVQFLSLAPYMDLSPDFCLDFWIMGARFDLRVASIVTIPPLLFGWLFAFSEWRFKKILGLSNFWYGLCSGAVVLAGVCNFFWIRTYGHPFDAMIFGIVDEDTAAVLESIWEDYPVIVIIAVSSLAAWGAAKGMRFVHGFLLRDPPSWGAAKFIFAIILASASWAFMARGSFGHFPLRTGNVAVTPQPAVNEHVPSGILAFGWTIFDHRNKAKVNPVSMADFEEAARYFGLAGNPREPKSLILSVTPANEILEKIKPNVALIVMESMSRDMMNMDEPGSFDVLGPLRDAMSDPRVVSFDNFLSEGDGTIDSLARIMVRSGDHSDHSVGRYAGVNFFTSILRPYKKAGYRTVLVTAGLQSWRKLGDFAAAQGIDEIIDQTVLAGEGECEASTWGVYDGCAFDALFSALQKRNSDGKPVFALFLSVTNHSPYSLPNNYDPGLPSSWEKVSQRYKGKEDIMDMFGTLKYANDRLGSFLLGVERDPLLSKNTVVAFTGDHNIRGLGVYQKPEDQVLGHMVPFAVYVPEEIRVAVSGFVADRARFSSQKDIMPTLYGISLSEARHRSTGCNLFSEEKCPYDFAYNQSVAVTKNGVCITQGNSRRSYPLDGAFAASPQESETAAKACEDAAAFESLQDILYRFQVEGADR